MSTAHVLFEQYKVLPSRIQRELKTLINQDENDEPNYTTGSLPLALSRANLIRWLKPTQHIHQKDLNKYVVCSCIYWV